LIVDQHYLHAADLVGEQIRYIAECVEHARVKRCFLLDSYSTNPSAFSEGKNGKCLSDYVPTWLSACISQIVVRGSQIVAEVRTVAGAQNCCATVSRPRTEPTTAPAVVSMRISVGETP
jgi:hypothetical protein